MNMSEQKMNQLIEDIFYQDIDKNCKTAVINHIEDISSKPLPPYEPIIPSKFWVIMLLLPILIGLIYKLSIIDISFSFESISFSWLNTLFYHISNIPPYVMLLPLVVLFLTLLDYKRSYV